MTGPRRFDVPVSGGSLLAAQWGTASPTVLAVHGITATHMAWLEVAPRLPDVTVLAPDLRGRGGSAQLPGPYGFERHVADLVSLLDAMSLEQVVVVGHSMGGFVASRLAATHPDRVSGLVLVDGGLPLGRPEDTADPMDIDAALGPAAARLGMTFSSKEEYRDFWRAHPAMGPLWGPAVAAYVDYDLVGEPPEMHSSCRAEAMRIDGAEVADHARAAAVLAMVQAPTVFLRAERGLLDEPIPLYPADTVTNWLHTGPAVSLRTAPDTNHYSVLLGERGAAEVAAAVTRAIESHPTC